MFKAFYLSFFSKPFYQDIVAHWRGPAFGLLFAIVTVHVLVFTIYLNQNFSLFLQTEAPSLVAQIPEIKVMDGQVRIDKPWPYYIKARDGSTIVTFDVHFNEAQLKAGQIWVTADKVYVRRSNYDEMRTYGVGQANNLGLNKEIVQGWLDSAKKWFMAVTFPLLLIGMFLLRMLQVGIYSLIGLALNKVMGVYLEYPQIVRLCVASLIPVLLLDCILMLVYPVSLGWYGFFIAMGYLIFGLRANRELIR